MHHSNFRHRRQASLWAAITSLLIMLAPTANAQTPASTPATAPSLPTLPALNCDDVAATSQNIAELSAQNQSPEQIYNTITPENATPQIRIQNLFIIPPIIEAAQGNSAFTTDNMREHCRHSREGYINNINTVCEMFMPLIEQAAQARDTGTSTREQSLQTTQQTFEAAIPRGQDPSLDLANTVMTRIGNDLVNHIYDNHEKNITQLTIEFNASCRYRSN